MNTAKITNSAADRELILVVDDEEAIRNIISACFDQEGIRCVTAASAREAITVVNTVRLTLVLLDWDLDGASANSGLQVLRVCRELYPLMPVIVMSGLHHDVQTDAVIEEADGFLAKPISHSVIKSHVNRWLKRLRATPKAFLPQCEEEILPFEDFKRAYIRHVVQLLDNNVSLAAKRLQVHRQTVATALKSDATPESDSPSVLQPEEQK